MLLSIAALVVGLSLLVWAADRFVLGAAATARNLGMSPLIIGLTIVAVATSAPEILISAIAAWQGNPGLSIGNAVGSNIANIGLILGITALISPLRVRSDTLTRELPLMLVIVLLAYALMANGYLGRLDGLLLLVGLAVVLYGIVGIGLRARKGDPMHAEFSTEIPAGMSMSRALTWLVVGLLVLLGSSRMLVWGAVNIATALGVSDLLIGLTIVAVGTSLPELAATVASALRKEADLAIGTVIGSNMFNLLIVLAIPGLIQPGTFPTYVLTRDFPVMIALTIALFVMAYGFRGPGRINRVEGAMLLACFIGYQSYLYYTA
ncbi:MAG: calcium/sodium antiporter [Acidiferrobacterales bacterium]